MKIVLVPWLVLLHASSLLAAETMRVDYYHTGNDREEHFSLDRMVIEPLPWPGSPSRTTDTTNLGKYLFEVVDAATGRVIFSSGFSSIYGEWETTAEARTATRTFSESLRFPAVGQPARIVLKKRDSANVFQEVWTQAIDPRSPSIQRGAKPVDAGPLIRVHEAGDPERKFDLLLVGDGYTVDERAKFERDARRLTGVLFATSPFRERTGDINVWALAPASAESGISQPSRGVHRRSALGSTYDALGLERYVLTLDNRTMRDIVANAPYDAVQIVVNSETYGGGGIHGLYSIVAADNAWAPYLFVHELGHQLAGLADEYYTSEVTYLPSAQRVEPWEPNVTALLDPAALKWRDLVARGTPVPTPWPKERFEQHMLEAQEARRQARARGQSEREIDLLAREQAAGERALLTAAEYAGRAGAFEGANYQAQGYFRPEIDCIMFSRNREGFCAVCMRAIVAALDWHSRP
jgi:hypothetical protein